MKAVNINPKHSHFSIKQETIQAIKVVDIIKDTTAGQEEIQETILEIGGIK